MKKAKINRLSSFESLRIDNAARCWGGLAGRVTGTTTAAKATNTGRSGENTNVVIFDPGGIDPD